MGYLICWISLTLDLNQRSVGVGCICRLVLKDALWVVESLDISKFLMPRSNQLVSYAYWRVLAAGTCRSDNFWGCREKPLHRPFALIISPFSLSADSSRESHIAPLDIESCLGRSNREREMEKTREDTSYWCLECGRPEFLRRILPCILVVETW